MEPTLIKQFASVFQIDGAWVLIVFFALYSYRYVKLKYNNNKQKRTETLSNLKDYCENKGNDILIKELLYKDHFGKTLSINEIEYFKRTKYPLKHLYSFINCGHFLEVSDNSRSISIKNNKNLEYEKWKNIILYFITGTFSLVLILNAYNAFQNGGPSLYAPWTIVTLSFATLAGIFVNESVAASNAKKLINELNT